MAKITTVLFDFDGVVTNTEPQYDIFFDNLAEKHNLGITNFASKIKGVTSPNILKKYFSHFSSDQIAGIEKEIEDFEKQMDFPPIDGALEFIHLLKEKGYKVGLVTSSQGFKMKIALNELNLTGVFDIEITANHITEGKPNPMCYLLAAKGLNVQPSECLVFEDSLFGIDAGNAAGMKVIGLSTTNPVDLLKDKCIKVIPDFTAITISDIEAI